MNRKHFLAVAASLLPLCLSAEETEPEAEFEPFVVTATRTRVPLDRTLIPTIVITRDEIERSLATDVADILRFHAGLDIARNGGPGQPTSVFLRGTDSNHTLVLVDGVKINPGTIGGAAFQNISPDIVERIEVVKGPRSSLYGSDAIGGIVNIITRNGSGGTEIAAAALGGKYETKQATLSYNQSFKEGDFGLTASWYDTEGFPTRAGDDVNRGYDNLSLNLVASTEFGPLGAELRHWQSSGTTEYSDFFLAPVDQDYENRATALEVSARPSTSWATKATISYLLDDIEQNQSPDFATTSRYSLDWQNDFDLSDDYTVVAGLYVSQEDTEALSFGLGFDESITENAVYAELLMSFDRQEAMLAGRYNDHETFGNEFIWNAEWGYFFTPATRIAAGIGTAFRAPDSTDLFGFGGNPNLDPESSRNYEVNVRHLIGTRHELTLGAFRNEIDDLIEFVITDPITFAGLNQNVDQALIEGIEASYLYHGNVWDIRADVIHQDPRDETTGELLLRRAQNSLSLNIMRDLGPHQLALDVLVHGEREDFGFPDPVTLDEYALINLSGRYVVTRNWSVQAKIENLLDEDYELANGFNTAGRGLYVRVNYNSR